jgi:hypothetical protein
MTGPTENVHLRFVPHSKGTDILIRDLFLRTAVTALNLPHPLEGGFKPWAANLQPAHI